MDSTRDEFLAGAVLALDQHRRVYPRHLADLLINELHRFTLTQKIVKVRPLVEHTSQVMNFRDVV
jgi:hypothetical protein